MHSTALCSSAMAARCSRRACMWMYPRGDFTSCTSNPARTPGKQVYLYVLYDREEASEHTIFPPPGLVPGKQPSSINTLDVQQVVRMSLASTPKNSVF